MSDIGNSVIRSLEEALAHANGQGPALVHEVVDPLAIRGEAGLSQAQMATLMGFSVEDYEEWERSKRLVNGPASIVLRILQTEPDAVRRALNTT